MSTNIYHVVTPWGQWVYWESMNVSGRPATHLVKNHEDRTMCGRNADGWMTQTHGDVLPEYIEKNYKPDTGALCKRCAAAFKKLERE